MRLIGRKSWMQLAPTYLGMRVIKVELRPLETIPLEWNSSRRLTKSCLTMSQHCWKKAMVKPSGLGALSSTDKAPQKTPRTWSPPMRKVFPANNTSPQSLWPDQLENQAVGYWFLECKLLVEGVNPIFYYFLVFTKVSIDDERWNVVSGSMVVSKWVEKLGFTVPISQPVHSWFLAPIDLFLKNCFLKFLFSFRFSKALFLW